MSAFNFNVAQPEIHTTPIGNPPAWTVVVAAAGWQCECKGSCGRPHARTNFRCDRVHDRAGVRLVVAPADLTLTLATAAEADADELHAWCPDCHRLAQRRQRDADRNRARLDAAAPDALFDL